MTTTKILHNVCITYVVSGHNGHKPKRSKPKRSQNEIASDRNGHRPKRPQTETATNRNGHKPKRPQIETATNRNGHKPAHINCIETWSRVDFFGQFCFRFCQLHSCFFSLYVCHYGDSNEKISYSDLLLYPKGYAHGFVCIVVFILQFHIALT